MPKKTAAPKKKPAPKRTRPASLLIWFSLEERAMLERVAKREGLSLADTVRQLLRRADRKA
ncbi:MAG TPA: hypothetical protein VF316_13770 [Polyangiaceae bacterium]